MTVRYPWGWWRVTISGQDISKFRDAPISGSFTTVEPFGCAAATFTIPGINPLSTPGTGSLSWLVRGAPAEIWWLDPDGSKASVWSGAVSALTPAMSGTSGRIGVECVGDMEAASLQNWQPPPAQRSLDIGYLIADALNAVVGRKYSKIARVTTGIRSTYRGSDDQSVLAFCQELLSTAVTDDGTNQWTVRRSGRRAYEIALKNMHSTHWTIRTGQPGMEFSLTADETQAPTRIFGSGVTTEGYSWKNMTYPSSFQNGGAPYPFDNPSHTLSLGSTDAGTDTGTGVSDLQERINDLNITGNVEVDGVLNANDIAAIRVIQRDLGLNVDGIVGGQTWTGAFMIGGGALGDAVRLPLAQIVAGRPAFNAPDGGRSSVNADYSGDLLVVDKDINFGGGVSKADGRRAALAMLYRDYPAGLAGSITLKADPRQDSRRMITAGQNIKLLGVEGGDPLLHAASVTIDLEGPVSCAVDQKGRDLLNLVQIMQRNRDNAINPAGLPKSKFARRALLSGDTVTPFDGESPAGRVPTTPLYAGLWSVIAIPASEAGRLAKIEFQTSPATKYAMSFFGAPITPNQLKALVPDPLHHTDPYSDVEDELRGYGWIESWGSSTDACGLKKNGTSITATWRDEGTLEYRSLQPPLIWIAFMPANSTKIRGRLYPAPLDA